MHPRALALRPAYQRDALEKRRTGEGATRQRGKEGGQEVGAEDQRLFLTKCQHSILNDLYSCDLSPRFVLPTLGIFAKHT